jgi:hypothetical protein
MKRIALALITAAFAASAFAWQCGITPLVPPGCRAVCICDMNGNNCHWATVC